jgi:hypothetical protein
MPPLAHELSRRQRAVAVAGMLAAIPPTNAAYQTPILETRSFGHFGGGVSDSPSTA